MSTPAFELVAGVPAHRASVELARVVVRDQRRQREGFAERGWLQLRGESGGDEVVPVPASAGVLSGAVSLRRQERMFA